MTGINGLKISGELCLVRLYEDSRGSGLLPAFCSLLAGSQINMLFLSTESDAGGTRIFVDGRPMAGTTGLKLTIPNHNSPVTLVVGNSVYARQSWNGDMFGLAIYTHALTPAVVAKHFSQWKKARDFSMAVSAAPEMLYLFDDVPRPKPFNRMGDSLERLEQLRKSMVSDVAHELRTPLTNLRGYLEGLSDGVIPPDKATFEMLQQENLRLVNLVEDLGQLARADAARAYLDRRPVDLTGCINEMLNLYRMNIDDKQIRVSTRFADAASTVAADRDKLLQAVRNLIDNCLKYTPQGGAVTITSTRTAGGVRVDFVNDGPGIPTTELPYVFERFYRAEYSRSRDAGGAGIGLAIVKQLIEAHGGRVGAESTPGETRIWFELPA